jgi:glycine cleavage system H protein
MADMKFTKTHEWVSVEGDIVTIGITNHAQHALGDMVFIELPDIGEMIAAGRECAVVESVKSASDVYAPLSGEVAAVNDAALATPDIVNKDPEKEGWLFKIRLSNPKELTDLMDVETYEAYLAEIAH